MEVGRREVENAGLVRNWEYLKLRCGCRRKFWVVKMLQGWDRTGEVVAVKRTNIKKRKRVEDDVGGCLVEVNGLIESDGVETMRRVKKARKGKVHEHKLSQGLNDGNKGKEKIVGKERFGKEKRLNKGQSEKCWEEERREDMSEVTAVGQSPTVIRLKTAPNGKIVGVERCDGQKEGYLTPS